MALIPVVFVNGNEGTVTQSWIDRWPEDIERVIGAPIDPAPVGEETETVSTVTHAPTGKKKEK